MIQSTPIKAVTGRDDAVIWPIVADGRLTSPSGITRMVIVFTKDGYDDVIVDSDDVPSAYDFVSPTTMNGRLVNAIRWIPGIAIDQAFAANGRWKGRVYLWDALTGHEGIEHGTFILDIDGISAVINSLVATNTGSLVFGAIQPMILPTILSLPYNDTAFGNSIGTSGDGQTWVSAVSGTLIGATVTSVAYSPSLRMFALVSATGSLIWTSVDGGATWQSHAVPTSSQQVIIWSQRLGLFVVLGASNTGYTSPDGEVWTSCTVNTSGALLYGLVDAEALGLLVASGNGWVVTSPDGITWTAQISGSFAPSVSRQGLAWSPSLGLLVAVGVGSPRVATSIDGISWTNRTALSRPWAPVIWVDELELFVACASGFMMRSSDGITWTDFAVPAGSWRSMAWSPKLGLLMVVAASTAPGIMVTSVDAINWNSHAIPSGSLAANGHCIATSG